MVTYVYALADTVAVPEGLRAWNDASLVLVDCGVCLAVTAQVTDAPPPTEEHLRAQDTLVRALMPGAPALLPARFGMVVADAMALRARLAPDQAAVLAALALVRDREQMTLRLVAREDTEAEKPDPVWASERTPGRRYLQRRAAQLAPPPALVQLERDLQPFIRGARLQVRSPTGEGHDGVSSDRSRRGQPVPRMRPAVDRVADGSVGARDRARPGLCLC